MGGVFLETSAGFLWGEWMIVSKRMIGDFASLI